MRLDGNDSSPDPQHSTPKPRGVLNLPLPPCSPYSLRSCPSESSPNPRNAQKLTPTLANLSIDDSESEDAIISRDEGRRLRLEVVSLKLEICALRLQHDEELKAICMGGVRDSKTATRRAARSSISHSTRLTARLTARPTTRVTAQPTTNNESFAVRPTFRITARTATGFASKKLLELSKKF